MEKKISWANESSIEELETMRNDFTRVFYVAYAGFAILAVFAVLQTIIFAKEPIYVLITTWSLSIIFAIFSIGLMLKWETRTIIITIKQLENIVLKQQEK